MGKTKIEWADAVWNPVTGCTKVSEGCRNCYAERMAKRLAGRYGYPVKEPFKATMHENRLDEPLKWRKPKRIFLCSMGDLFHSEITDAFIYQTLAIMTLARQHTFMILTKRPNRMFNIFNNLLADKEIKLWQEQIYYQYGYCPQDFEWPLKNLWLGISIENQKAADERLPLFLQTPAKLHFISCEPLLASIDLYFENSIFINNQQNYIGDLINWVIAGGENRPGKRVLYPANIRWLRDQCLDMGIPFFFKGWGASYWEFDQSGRPYMNWKFNKNQSNRILDGKEWQEYPRL